MSGVSDVVCGKVTAIMNFGAFILLEDGTSGLVHISEISKNFVRDVNDFLSVGQQVRVVSLATDHDGKKRLSIKKADEILTQNGDGNVNEFKNSSSDAEAGDKRHDHRKPGQNETKISKSERNARHAKEAENARRELISQPPPMFDELRGSQESSFEDRLSRYMKMSEERLSDVKRQSENKRGGGYVRRG